MFFFLKINEKQTCLSLVLIAVSKRDKASCVREAGAVNLEPAPPPFRPNEIKTFTFTIDNYH